MKRTILILLIATLFLSSASSLLAQDGWKDPNLPWIAVASGVVAGTAIEWIIATMWDPEPQHLRVTAATAGMAASIASSMAFFYYVGDPNVWISMGMGSLWGGAAAFVSAGIAQAVAETLGSNAVGDPPGQVVSNTLAGFVNLGSFCALPGAALGMVSGAVLGLTLYQTEP